jgi:hypothetical protein
MELTLCHGIPLVSNKCTLAMGISVDNEFRKMKGTIIINTPIIVIFTLTSTTLSLPR